MRWIVRIAVLGALALAGPAGAAVYNVRVVSDSRPDFTDMDSLVRSATGAYPTMDEKCRAMWRWLTRCRRQTPQPVLHGTPVHDPIMFLNDFGYSFCSDYAAINDGIWHSMGLPVRLSARHVQCKVTNREMFLDTSELMVDDSVRVEEWREPLVTPLD